MNLGGKIAKLEFQVSQLIARLKTVERACAGLTSAAPLKQPAPDSPSDSSASPGLLATLGGIHPDPSVALGYQQPVPVVDQTRVSAFLLGLQLAGTTEESARRLLHYLTCLPDADRQALRGPAPSLRLWLARRVHHTCCPLTGERTMQIELHFHLLPITDPPYPSENEWFPVIAPTLTALLKLASPCTD
jgi:hypothetical protein